MKWHRLPLVLIVLVWDVLFVNIVDVQAANELLQSQTTHPLQIFITQSSDHITGLTGASPTVTISKDGAAFASPSGAVTEIGNGWYKVAGNATDEGTLGQLDIHATATSGDPSDTVYQIIAINKDSATNMGLSALPTASAAASGGLPEVGTGSGQINLSSGHVANVDTLTTYTGNTVQTGDAFALIGTAGVGLTNLGGHPQTGDSFARLGAPSGASIDADILTRSTYAGGAILGITGVTLPSVVPSLSQIESGLPTDASIATDAQTGLTAQGYTTTRAPKLDDLDAAISSRGTSTLTQAQVSGGGYPISTTAGVVNLPNPAPSGYGGSGGGFTGSDTVNLSAVDSSNNPIPYVAYTVQSVGYKISDVNGAASISLNPGSYTITVTAAGFIFPSTPITVTGNMTVAPIVGTGIVITPATPPFCNTSITTTDIAGNAQSGISITYTMTQIPPGSGIAFGAPISRTSPSGGQIIQQLVQGAQYQVQRGSNGPGIFVTIGTNPTQVLPNLKGAP